ncbi:DsbA family oxidoreductase [Blastococcus sp. SYSU D00820]
MTVDVPAGCVVVYTDVVCAWSTIALHRFYEARTRLGLDEQVRIAHRLFALEDVNRFAIPLGLVQPEIPVVGTIEPDFGFTPWQGQPSEWPVTSLPANEAVHAAARQSPEAAEELDMALRRAFFRDSRCISLLHEIVDVAGECPAVDARELQAALEDGRARGPMMADYRARADEVEGSPHFFLGDGTDVHSPGIDLHWQGEPGAGFPVVDRDDRSVWDDLVRRAADAARRG